jgi:hypothetical protein
LALFTCSFRCSERCISQSVGIEFTHGRLDDSSIAGQTENLQREIAPIQQEGRGYRGQGLANVEKRLHDVLDTGLWTQAKSEITKGVHQEPFRGILGSGAI